MKPKREPPDGPILCERHAHQIAGKVAQRPEGPCEPLQMCDVAAGNTERIERYLAKRGVTL